MKNQDMDIVRPIQVVRGYRNIAATLRTSEDRVRDMMLHGAPVLLDGDMPRAEAAELWAWYSRWMRETGGNGARRPPERGRAFGGQSRV